MTWRPISPPLIVCRMQALDEDTSIHGSDSGETEMGQDASQGASRAGAGSEGAASIASAMTNGLRNLWGRGSKPASREASAMAPQEGEAEQRARESAARCRVADLWADSRYYPAESLVSFAEALVSASGLDASQPSTQRQHVQGADEQKRLQGLIAGLNMVIAVAVRNKDRVAVLWPTIHRTLQGILPHGAPFYKAFSSRECLIELVRQAIASVVSVRG